VLGALASGILLYGATLVYGFTGTTSFDKLAALHPADGVHAVGLLIGMALVATGLIFKVSAVRSICGRPTFTRARPLR